MATYEYDQLLKEYNYFHDPFVLIKVNGKDIAASKKGLVISDIDVTLSSGFEANIASFHIYNAFQMLKTSFNYDNVSAFIQIGSVVTIALGYDNTAAEVFTGVITKVNFVYETQEYPPYIKVTCMDVKGIMMANSYAKSLVAYSYGEAVKEIFQKTAYMKLTDKEVMQKVTVEDTPDKGAYNNDEENDFSIEMENESDYEFVVRAAKKFNYEFFTRNKEVIFRKARSEDEVMMEINPSKGLAYFDVEYDITGLVETIEVRGMDTAKGKLVSAKQKLDNKLSEGNRAKALISGSQKIIIDPTIKSQKDADERVKAHVEKMAYRYGTFSGMMVGIPDLVPGKFIELKDMGKAISNKFYVTEIRHVLGKTRFETYITGQAAKLP